MNERRENSREVVALVKVVDSVVSLVSEVSTSGEVKVREVDKVGGVKVGVVNVGSKVGSDPPSLQSLLPQVDPAAV